MKIYTGLIKDLGCRCFYYNSGMNIPIGFVCAEIPDISSILSSKNGLSHFYEHMIIKRNDDISDKLFFDFNGYTDPRSLVFKGFTLPDVDIKKCIDFSYNFIVYPDISEDLIESERNVILTEINDNIEYAIRMIKLDDRLNIMNIEYYHDAYISFVRSRLNGVMDLYKSYDNISVDDVMDMIKDITEDRLIIQYCSL